jgi:hypothetical protein
MRLVKFLSKTRQVWTFLSKEVDLEVNTEKAVYSCEISSFHGGEYEDDCLLGWSTV